MEDLWCVLNLDYGTHKELIKYNRGYAEIGKSDHKPYYLRIWIPVKRPDERGWAAREEFDEIVTLEEKMQKAIEMSGGRSCRDSYGK